MSEGRKLDRRRVYDGRVFRLSVDRVELPNGRTTELAVIEHPGAAAVVPLDRDGQVVLVRQYRHAASTTMLEVPAGTLAPGESPEHCAEREVEEETGFRAARFWPLGWIWTTPGLTDEKIWLFLATGLTATRQKLDVDEILSVTRMPFDEAVRQAREGEISDGKSVCALVRAEAWLQKNGRPADGAAREEKGGEGQVGKLAAGDDA